MNMMCSTCKDRLHIESGDLPVAVIKTYNSCNYNELVFKLLCYLLSVIKTCNSCNYNELVFKLYVLLVVDSSQCSEPHRCYD